MAFVFKVHREEKVDPKPVTLEERPSLVRAKQQYAAAHGMAPADVTEKMLSDSEDGIEGWACKGLDCKARGPMGNAMYRSFKKNPAASEAYKWLFEDLKKKFRQSWAMERSFDFIQQKRIKTVTCKTRREEMGSWKSALQLEAHFGGVGIPEAKRQADNYMKKCKDYGVTWLMRLTVSNLIFKEAFVSFNEWTEAENFLLIEKLVSMSHEEAWSDMAELCDSSATFQLESYRCRAMRKYACYHGKSVEKVTLEEVQNSPQGLQAWAEMSVAVPGISTEGGAPSPAPSSSPGTTSVGGTPPPVTPAKRRRGGGGDDGEPTRKKTKKEPTSLQKAESAAKEVLTHLAWSSQVMDRCTQQADSFPSQWTWSKPFLEQFGELQVKFKKELSQTQEREDLTNFLDNMKLSVLNKAGLRSLKKEYGDRYEAYLVMLVDRCQAIASQPLV